MDIFTLAMWIGTLVFLGYSFNRDKKETKKALIMAFRMGRGMLFNIIPIIFAIGIILTLIPPTEIASFISKQNNFLATIASSVVGTITLIPAFVAFPLVGSLVDAGVGMVPSVAFLTTLTMVGVVTIPLERKEFGTKFTIVRNSLSFIFAIIIALVMGVFI